MRVARSVAHEKADYYAAILDELKERSGSLPSSAHQRLLLGLLGDPTRAKGAKESSALLKAIQRKEPSQFSRSSSRQHRRQRPYAPSQPLCFRCGLLGHFARACYRGRGRGSYKRQGITANRDFLCIVIFKFFQVLVNSFDCFLVV